VTYRDDPLRLAGWQAFYDQLARTSAAAFDSYLAASSSVTCLPTTSFKDIIDIDSVAPLAAMNFDRAAYSRDLCFEGGPPNVSLLDELSAIEARLQPDIVFSVAENRYLKQVFGPKVLFMEAGPLPRVGMHWSIHIDPFGHQMDSALDRLSNWDLNGRYLLEFADLWERRWLTLARRKGKESGLANWLANAAKGRKVLLAALQPSDWITYEGIGPSIDPVSMLRLIAWRAPANWTVMPEWHGADKAPSDQLVDELTRLQPNIIVPPPELRMSHSDEALPYVDAVATISSNVAAAAAISGLSVWILGQSKFRSLHTGLEARAGARADLLAFLICRYCQPLQEVLTKEGAFAEWAFSRRYNPNSIFEMSNLDVARFEDFMIREDEPVEGGRLAACRPA
jgi:hypothetical protein